MPVVSINGASNDQKWSYVSDPGGWFSYTSIPSGYPANPSGDRVVLVVWASLALGGVGGNKTASYWVSDAIGNYRKTTPTLTVPASSAATVQPSREFSPYFGARSGQTIRIGFNQVTKPIYVGRGAVAGSRIYGDPDAYNGYGWPGFSLSGTYGVATLPTAPGRPSLSTGSDNPGQMNISWGAPSITGDSAITGYRVQVSRFSNFSSATTYSTGTARTLSLSGLVYGAVYYVRVAAVNAVATIWGTTSAWSASNSITVAGTPPAPPDPLPIVNVSDGTNWDEILRQWWSDGETWFKIDTKVSDGTTWQTLI